MDVKSCSHKTKEGGIYGAYLFAKSLDIVALLADNTADFLQRGEKVCIENLVPGMKQKDIRKS